MLCLALSADGKKLAAGGCDRLVRVWDLSPGYAAAKLEQTIENHADWVFGVAFSPDGKALLTCSRDKTAKVWDLEKKESLMTFPDHQNGVYGVAVKADGKIGFSVGADGQLRTWNATGDGKQVRATGGHSGDVLKLVTVPKKPLLVSCGADKTVRVWNGDNGKAEKTLNGLTDWVFAIAVSPDGDSRRGGQLQRRGRGVEARRRRGGQGVQRLAGVASCGSPEMTFLVGNPDSGREPPGAVTISPAAGPRARAEVAPGPCWSMESLCTRELIFMPVTIICSSCRAKLTAPDKLVGKKVKCPKCQTPVLVPNPADLEETEVMQPAATPKPKPNPRPAATKARPSRPPVSADEEEEQPRKRKPVPDEDEDDEPKKKPKKKKKSALPVILIGGGAGLLVALIAVVILIILFLWPSPEGPPKLPVAGITGQTKPAGITWVAYDDPEFFFKAAFPNAKPASSDPLAETADPVQRQAMGPLIKNGKGRFLTATDAGHQYQLLAFSGLDLFGVPGRTMLGQMPAFLGELNKGFEVDPRADLDVSGHPAKDFTLRKGPQVKLVRVIIATGIIYFVSVDGGQDLTPDDSTAKDYFSKFVSTKPPASNDGLPKDLIP